MNLGNTECALQLHAVEKEACGISPASRLLTSQHLPALQPTRTDWTSAMLLHNAVDAWATRRMGRSGIRGYSGLAVSFCSSLIQSLLYTLVQRYSSRHIE